MARGGVKVGVKEQRDFLEQWVRDEARWQRVEFWVFLNLSLYLLVFPPEGKVLV